MRLQGNVDIPDQVFFCTAYIYYHKFVVSRNRGWKGC